MAIVPVALLFEDLYGIIFRYEVSLEREAGLDGSRFTQWNYYRCCVTLTHTDSVFLG